MFLGTVQIQKSLISVWVSVVIYCFDSYLLFWFVLDIKHIIALCWPAVNPSEGIPQEQGENQFMSNMYPNPCMLNCVIVDLL